MEAAGIDHLGKQPRKIEIEPGAVQPRHAPIRRRQHIAGDMRQAGHALQRLPADIVETRLEGELVERGEIARQGKIELAQLAHRLQPAHQLQLAVAQSRHQRRDGADAFDVDVVDHAEIGAHFVIPGETETALRPVLLRRQHAQAVDIDAPAAEITGETQIGGQFVDEAEARGGIAAAARQGIHPHVVERNAALHVEAAITEATAPQLQI